MKVMQSDKSDCGAAALVSVAAYLGVDTSIPEVRHLSGTDKDGTTIKGLIEAAEFLGLKAKGYKGGVESFCRIPTPAIIHLKRDYGYLHFVVLKAADQRSSTVMDPMFGEYVKVATDKLTAEWTGYVVVFDRAIEINSSNRKFKSSRSKRVTTKLIRDIIVGNRLNICLSVILSVLAIISSLSVALVIKEIIDVKIPGGDFNGVALWATFILAASALSVFFSLLRSVIVLNIAVKTDKKLSVDYIKHLFSLPLSFFKTFRAGELTSRIGDIYKIREMVAGTIPAGVVAAITLVISVVILFVLNVNMAFICTLFIPLFLLVYITHDRYNRGAVRRVMESSSLFQGVFVGALGVVSSIKNFGYEKRAVESCSESVTLLNKRAKEAGVLSVYASTAAEIVSRGLTVVVLWVGSLGVAAGKLTIGDLVSFFAIVSMFSSPLIQLASSISSLREGKIAAGRLGEIISVKGEEGININKSANLTQEQNLTERFRLDVQELSFGYPGRELLFQRLNFSLVPGKIVLLTGENGMGKSTLTHILMRHLNQNSGDILCNGKSYKSFELDEWRRLVTIVPQIPHLYGASLFECICGVREIEQADQETGEYFNQICTELDLWAIAAALPEGFASYPGEGGSFLSKGQQQRVSFARALMRRAKVLILDEATASLDRKSEGMIFKVLLRLKAEGCSILMISHNLNCIKIADEVIDMEGAHSRQNLSAVFDRQFKTVKS